MTRLSIFTTLTVVLLLVAAIASPGRLPAIVPQPHAVQRPCKRHPFLPLPDDTHAKPQQRKSKCRLRRILFPRIKAMQSEPYLNRCIIRTA